MYTGSDFTNLIGIARQNPLAGGDAVYTASVLLDSFIVLHDSMGISYKTDKAKQMVLTDDNKNALFKLYPNPAHNTLTIDYT